MKEYFNFNFCSMVNLVSSVDQSRFIIFVIRMELFILFFAKPHSMQYFVTDVLAECVIILSINDVISFYLEDQNLPVQVMMNMHICHRITSVHTIKI